MARKIAIVSDIHGNLAALEAVLADIDRQRVDEIVCLGDIVGYGPQPAECLELVRKRCRTIIMGNHDEGIENRNLLAFYRPPAKESLTWTIGVLTSGQRSFLGKLPRIFKRKGLTFVHGSPRRGQGSYDLGLRHTHEYIDASREMLSYAFRKSVFSSFDGVCFVGHSHKPGVFRRNVLFVPPEGLRNGGVRLTAKSIVCVGSVGQPRTDDLRPTYVVFKESRKGPFGAIRFHRVDYDVSKTVELIRKISEWSDPVRESLIYRLTRQN